MGRMGRVGTWNVRSFGILGKLTNVMNEMKRMGVGIMGVGKQGNRETCWDKEKEWTFTGKLPESEGEDKYIVNASGGDMKRKEVGMIVREEVAKSVMMCERMNF